MAADQDTYFDPEVSVFKLHDGTSLRTITPYVINLDGLPGDIKMSDITTWGSAGEKPGPSLYVVHFTLELLFNMITDVGTHTVLALLFNNKTLAAYEYYPGGATAGNAKISGNAYLSSYKLGNRVMDKIVTRADFQGHNGVTVGVAT